MLLGAQPTAIAFSAEIVLCQMLLDTKKRALRRFHTVDIRVAEAGAGTLA